MSKLPVPDRRPYSPGRIEAPTGSWSGRTAEAVASSDKATGRTLVGVWLPDDLLAKLDGARGGQTRPGKIRQILIEALS